MTWSMLSVNRRPAAPSRGGRPAAAPPLEARPRQGYQVRMSGEGIEGQAAVLPHAALMLRVAREQDRSAFAELFGHFGPRVKSYLMRLGSDASGAEDLLQEVMLAVWRRAATYDPAQAGVATWIFTIARNKRIDALRRVPRGALDPNDPALQPEPPPSPDHEAEAVRWEGAIAEAVAAMPREQAEILRLAYYEDISHSDIAARIGVPLGTVKSRLRLAMARLRTRFAEQA